MRQPPGEAGRQAGGTGGGASGMGRAAGGARRAATDIISHNLRGGYLLSKKELAAKVLSIAPQSGFGAPKCMLLRLQSSAADRTEKTVG